MNTQDYEKTRRVAATISSGNIDIQRVVDAVHLEDPAIARVLDGVPEPRIYRDGDSWCALHGVNLQEGVCGFGDTPYEAVLAYRAEVESDNR